MTNSFEAMTSLKDQLNDDSILESYFNSTFDVAVETIIGVNEEQSDLKYPFIKIVFGSEQYENVKLNYTSRTTMTCLVLYGVNELDGTKAEEYLSRITKEIKDAIERDIRLGGSVISIMVNGSTAKFETIGSQTPERIMEVNITFGGC